MKDKFYRFYLFLSSELHFFEYVWYMIFTCILFALYEIYDFDIKILEIFIYCILAMAFMNTWEIKARKYKKDVDKNE